MTSRLRPRRAQSPSQGPQVEAQPARPRPAGLHLSLGKKALLSLLVTIAFFALAEVILAVVGVHPVLYEKDPYVGFSGSSPLFVPEAGPDGTEMMVTARNKLRLFNLQRFPRAKGKRTYRIFCLGGSTAYGHPYTHSTSFCGWLGELLPVADPSRDWETINAGGISYASYREALLVEELIRYQPDLFIVISGHNEFLERRSYSQVIDLPPAMRRAGAIAAHTRTYALLRRAVEAVRRRPAQGQVSMLEPEVTTLLDDSVGPQAYTRDDALRDRVLQHFRFNLARMVDIARSAGAETILLSPASNLRGSSPFKSEDQPGLSQVDRERLKVLAAQARQAIAAGHDAEALTAIEQALAVDDRHAHLEFLAGQTYDRLGRFAEAKRAYERARDEDICPLRALGPTRGIVADVAASRRALLIDFFDLAERWSPQGIPGDNLFLDHVHPTIDGNRLLALTILAAMVRQGIVQPSSSWGEAAIQAVTTRVEASIDRTAQGLALNTLSKTLGWAGKLGDAYKLSQRALELAPDQAGVHYQAGLVANLLGRLDEAEHHYRQALEIDPAADLPHGNLGVLLEQRGHLEEAVAHYRRALELGDERAAPRNRENLAAALVRLGYQAYTQGRKEEAVAQLSEADRVRPKDLDTVTKLGIALLSVGRPAEAEERFRVALAMTPNDAALRNRLAIALAIQGKGKEASAEYGRALALDPALAASTESLPSVLARRGRSTGNPPR